MKSRGHRAFAIVFALASLSILATAAAASPWRPRLGLEGGLNAGRLGSNSQLGDGSYWKVGGSAGLVASWSLAPGWAIEGAPGWERQFRRGTGTLYDGNGLSLSGFDQSVRIDRVLLPVRAVFQPGTKGWLLEGGIAAAWLARAYRDNHVWLSEGSFTSPIASPARGPAQPDASIFESAGTFDEHDWTDKFGRWDAVLSVGAGWDEPAFGHALRTRVRWQQGLVDLSTFGDPVHLSSVSATIGVLW